MSKTQIGIAVILLAACGPLAGRCEEPGPRMDRYGDPLPPGALARMGTVRFARGDSTGGPPVLAPDHKTFATVSRHTPYGTGCVVCLWDAAAGKELRHFDDPDFEPYQVFYLRGDNLWGTLGFSRKAPGNGPGYAMQFWDPATGKKAPAGTLETELPFEPWALSPDESLLVSASREPPVVVRERRTGKVLAEWKVGKGRVHQLAFSPDGKTAAVCCETAVYLWNWKGDGKDRRLVDFPDGVERLWYSPDGRWVAAALYKEGLRVWKADGLNEVRRFPGEHDIRFFPDGNRLMDLDSGVVRDVVSGKQVGQWEGCAHCLALDFSADGKEAMGYAMGRVRFWDPETGKDHSPPAPADAPIMIHQIGFLPGGKEVVSASPDGAVRVWDATTGKALRTLVPGTKWDDVPTFLRVTPDGTVITARGTRLTFFKGEDKPEEFRLTGLAKGLESLSLSPDGRTLVLAGDRDKPVLEVWDVPGRKAVTHFSPPDGTFGAALGVSDDRKIAAFVSGSVSLLDASGSVSRVLLERRAEGGSSEACYFYGIQALTFSPEDNLLASSAPPGGKLRILDVLTGRPRDVLPGRNTAELSNVVFSADGQMVAAESEEGAVDVWETSTGRRRRRFLGHRSYQTTLAFSPDGGRLATGNRDATILIWDVFGVSADGPANSGPLKEAELDALWARLSGRDAEQACLAMGRLMAHPDESGPYLKRRVLGRKSPEAARFKRWIADLDDDDFDTREKASAELGKWLASAAPLLKERYADNPPPESRRRIKELLDRLESHDLPAETVRDLRALEVLESFGPAVAADAAGELSEGDYDPSIAAAAKAVRKRLTAGRR